jgi:hypothetical protein
VPQVSPLLRDLGLELPASGLQHVGFVERGDGEAFHRSGEVFADFK